MRNTTEQQLLGRGYLEGVTTLLQRLRGAHQTKGLFEAADLQWWWRTPRSTDELPQLFWFDQLGRPEAAVIATDWGSQVALNPMTMPDADPDSVAHLIERGLGHASEHGLDTVSLEVDREDDVLRDVLAGHGFAIEEDGLVETWLSRDARPDVSPLHDDYTLMNRVETSQRPHHLIKRSGPDVEDRLRQTSLYRPDHDLVVLDRDGTNAAHGLFWHDPVTATGLVEPMRTEDEHQKKGLARHVLTAGIDLLARAGAERIKICFRPGNAAAKGLYLSVGFEPVKQTDVFSGSTSAGNK